MTITFGDWSGYCGGPSVGIVSRSLLTAHCEKPASVSCRKARSTHCRLLTATFIKSLTHLTIGHQSASTSTERT